MPTAARIGPYRFFFYSRDCEEPIHIHVEREDKEAKFWVDPVRLERPGGFRSGELRRIERLVIAYRESLIQKWHEHCQ